MTRFMEAAARQAPSGTIADRESARDTTNCSGVLNELIIKGKGQKIKAVEWQIRERANRLSLFTIYHLPSTSHERTGKFQR